MMRSFVIGTIWLLTAAAPVRADMLDEYMALRVGSFSSEIQARHDSRYEVAIWHIGEIWMDENARERWIYVETWMKDAEAPYMQRVSQLTAQADGSIVARRFQIPQPERVLGGWQAAEKFSALTPGDLIELDGCAAMITRAGKGRFEGGTVGTRCRNGYKGAAYALSRSVLTEDEMINWDRGFSAAGELVWGPAAGGYRFTRLGADQSCVDPVRMLVYGEVFDRAKLGAYGRALAESGLYPQVNGYYEATTPPLEVFEGEPPAGRGVIIARFPCLAKAREYWNSDAYAEIRKLRRGAAEFEVLVLPVPPLPAYLQP
jgi:uncharacterized protein (DUF1330 family)